MTSCRQKENHFFLQRYRKGCVESIYMDIIDLLNKKKNTLWNILPSFSFVAYQAKSLFFSRKKVFFPLARSLSIRFKWKFHFSHSHSHRNPSTDLQILTFGTIDQKIWYLFIYLLRKCFKIFRSLQANRIFSSEMKKI